MTLHTLAKRKAFATLWSVSALERVGFFGIKGMLLLYMVKILGFGDARAYGILGGMMTISFITPLLGGWMADKFLGNYAVVLLGVFLSALGSIAFLFKTEKGFFLAISALVLGNGFIRSSLATLVGKFYQNDEHRRDSVFTLLYLSFNVGALLGVFFCAIIGETYGWNKGFTVAFSVYGLALFLMLFGRKTLEIKGGLPADSKLRQNKVLWMILLNVLIGSVYAGIYNLLEATTLLSVFIPLLIIGVYAYLLRLSYKISPEAGKAMVVLFILTLFQIIFFALYEQGQSSVLLFAERNVDRRLAMAFGMMELDLFSQRMTVFPTTFFNGIDPFFNIIFSAFFVWFWQWLDRLKKNPMEPYKFSFALILAALSFAILWYSRFYGGDTGKVSLWWTIFSYGTMVIAELCLAPFSMSLVIRLAPSRYISIAMGAVFLSVSASQWFAMLIAKMTSEAQSLCEGGNFTESLALYCDAFGQLVLWSLGAGLLLLLISPLFREFFHQQRQRVREAL